MRRNDRRDAAHVGIGTMVVFVAIVLVAAVAAGVLIGTSSDLKETPGGEDAAGGGSDLAVESLVGKRDDIRRDSLDGLEIYLTIPPGADDVDLSRLRIQVHNATAASTLHHGAVAIGDRFAATAVRDADRSLRAVPPVMTAGDLIRIDTDLDAATGIGVGIEAGDTVRVVIVPEHGGPLSVTFRTPDSYGSKLAMHLI